jgi:uncharacterized C2H2 Zn-finger protein
MTDDVIPECPACHRFFGTKAARDSHLRQTRDWRHDQCRWLLPQRALRPHQGARSAATDEATGLPMCPVCHRIFRSEQGRGAHVAYRHKRYRGAA